MRVKPRADAETLRNKAGALRSTANILRDVANSHHAAAESGWKQAVELEQQAIELEDAGDQRADAAARDDTSKWIGRTVTIPAALHEDSRRLVIEFADALAEKLHRAEQKYGYSNGWLTDNWEEKCRADLREHMEKGDPRDVAIYAAFMWRRGWSTSGTSAESGAASPSASSHVCPGGVPYSEMLDAANNDRCPKCGADADQICKFADRPPGTPGTPSEGGESCEVSSRARDKSHSEVKMEPASPPSSQTQEWLQVMGRFDHHPDPAIDFCVEVDAIEGMERDVAAGLETRDALLNRIERALGFRVGGDEGAVRAKSVLRAVHARVIAQTQEGGGATSNRQSAHTDHDQTQAAYNAAPALGEPEAGAKSRACKHHGTAITSYPKGCPTCGAPQCCKRCCDEALMEELAARAPHSTPDQAREAGELLPLLFEEMAWSQTTFGAGRHTNGLTKHIVKECEEIRANPNDLIEWVDVAMLAWDGFWRAGGTPADEAEHFTQCGDCGGWIDMRDLAEVFAHEKPGHKAELPI